mgnify:CR=1 FL=1
MRRLVARRDVELQAMRNGITRVEVAQAIQAGFGGRTVGFYREPGSAGRGIYPQESRLLPIVARPPLDERTNIDSLRSMQIWSPVAGRMIPLTALVEVVRSAGAEVVDRYNVFPAAKIVGGPAPGYSSGQALAAMEQVAAQTLDEDYSLVWTGSAYQERLTGGTSTLVFGFGLVMVFLILAAQYEKWTLPLSVLVAVPFGVCGALIAVFARGLNNDVYFQIGLVTLLGLAAKNAILIVEYAELKHREGMSASAAALEAARLRFRPIIMTSLAFILGVLPLAISSGAGAGARHSVGTGVMGGMLAATFLAIFFVPMFFRLITDRKFREARSTAEMQAEAREAHEKATAREAAARTAQANPGEGA